MKENQFLTKFKYILAALSTRDLVLLDLKYNQRKTGKQVGVILKITEERVRQIEKRCIEVIERELK